MIDKRKTDPELGKQIHEVLVEAGIETPMAEYDYDDDLKKNIILEAVRNIMRALNLNLDDDSLSETACLKRYLSICRIFLRLS